MNEKIRKLLDEKSITQVELAQAVGVSQAFISGIVKGYKMPSVPLLKRIADYLKVSVDEIIG